MCANDLTGNRKSHARAFEVLPPATAIELIENAGLFVLADARPLIRYVNDYSFVAGFCSDHNGTPGPRVLRRVIDQVHDHQHDQLSVYKHHWQVIFYPQLEISTIRQRIRLPKGSGNQRAWKVNLPIQLKLATFDSCKLNRFGNQPV